MDWRGRKISKAAVGCLEWISGGLLLAMMVLTFVDVIGRYVFTAPIFGAGEMIQFLLMGCVFSAMGIVSARDSHIAVELISPALERRFPRGYRWFVGAISLFGMSLIALQLLRIGLDAIERARVSVVMEWPIGAIAISSAIFCFIAAILFFAPKGNSE